MPEQAVPLAFELETVEAAAFAGPRVAPVEYRLCLRWLTEEGEVHEVVMTSRQVERSVWLDGPRPREALFAAAFRKALEEVPRA